ncbi:hypothetical protein [Mycobacterium sp. 1274756.6]|uniref:hypothetical protein n=1 Tax=Mycobacterium sp. 1274756.6 TaxID=1834076 RepID=UPI000B30345C|nr:hypothetical protein [Mycobacterium sp. 1274756.6]
MATVLTRNTAPHITALWRGTARPVTETDHAWADLGSRSRFARIDHESALVRLAELFRGSSASSTIDGPADIELLTTFAPGRLNQAASAWYDRAHPWATKTFDRATATGTNWFTAERRRLVRACFPRAPIVRSDEILDMLPFRTYLGPSALDANHDVLHIDYSHDRRNGLLLSRLSHDELVQVGPGVHLGIGLFGRRDRQTRGVLYFACRERNAQ